MVAVGAGDAAAKLAFNKIIQPAAQKFQPNIILVSSGRGHAPAAASFQQCMQFSPVSGLAGTKYVHTTIPHCEVACLLRLCPATCARLDSPAQSSN